VFAARVVLVTIKENAKDEFNTTDRRGASRISRAGQPLPLASLQLCAIAFFFVIVWASTGPIFGYLAISN
jgi:hypothetical protein